MAANGINAVRTYTAPPRWLLDIARRRGLLIMADLPWESHVAFLESRKTVRSIEGRVRAMIRGIAGHPALLCYVIGNEIPAPIVRWHGARKIEQFLKRLYSIAKEEDPTTLATYVNYPTTEYLQLPFLDFFCFNVYLEEQSHLEDYLCRLQNIACDRPLIMGEIGLDSRRNGEQKQAEVLNWQIRTSFRVGCAGVFIFAWTDEWYRGGYDIDDWDFGLLQRNRRPKPALQSVRQAFAEVPFPTDAPWPRISVVVCSYNGESTIAECCDRLQRLDYPDFEVIVVDDGSTDRTSAIANKDGFKMIRTPNMGLAAARNLGLEAATGEIVAYIDDDAYPDRDWLKYLALTFLTTDCAGAGGPNIPPPDDGKIADCVANAPGGPIHVLVSDKEAEHIPGCNMAFRKECLEAIGGFDPQFTAAGDDVDVCWRIQDRGWWLAFSASAMVWHHRRNSIRSYWRQQKGYGKAEALLERKWPEKYNAVGHLSWAGKVYGNGLTNSSGFRKPRIYHGTWGSAQFQSLYGPSSSMWESLPLMPEWYILNVALLGLCALGILWRPLLLALPLLAVTACMPLIFVFRSVAGASFTSEPLSRFGRLRLQFLTGLLHALQPMARLYGRMRSGLTPWRRHGLPEFSFPKRRTHTIWDEEWYAADKRLQSLEEALLAQSVIVRRGGNYDPWDLEVRGGLCGGVRLLMATEEHGAGRQLVRFRLWPRGDPAALVLMFLLVCFAVVAAVDQAWIAAAMLGIVVAGLAGWAFKDCAAAKAKCWRVLCCLDNLTHYHEEAEKTGTVPPNDPRRSE
jgi:GT2 family glycosyltransferase